MMPRRKTLPHSRQCDRRNAPAIGERRPRMAPAVLMMPSRTYGDDSMRTLNSLDQWSTFVAIAPDFDRVDVARAIYWYAANYHEGQSSPLYEVLSRSPYRPGPMENGIGPEDSARMLYDTLTGWGDVDTGEREDESARIDRADRAGLSDPKGMA